MHGIGSRARSVGCEYALFDKQDTTLSGKHGRPLLVSVADADDIACNRGTASGSALLELVV